MPSVSIPPRRVKDAASAMGVCSQLDRQDSLASENRRDIHAAIDGEVPFNQARLEEQGLGTSANFNDLTGDGLRNSALAAYVDYISNVKYPAEFVMKIEEDDERFEVAQIMAEEFKWFHDQWKYKYAMLRVADKFVVDGVGLAYWPDRWNPCWKVSGLESFKAPRQTEIGEENLETFKFGDMMSCGTLYNYIRNEKHAQRAGWNVEVCKKLIVQANDSYTPKQTWQYQWDKIQESIKENDLYFSHGSSYRMIPVNKLFVKEFSNKYSLYILPGENAYTGDFMYKGWQKFEDVSQILVTFVSGVGNGTYHSIRGLGWKMFPYLQVLNRTNCQMANGIMLAGSIVAQPKDAAALEEFQMAQMGGFTVVRGDVSFPTIGATNVASQVLPVQEALKNQLQANTGRYQSRSVIPDDPNRSATGERLAAARENVLSSADMALFDWSLGRLFKEEFRRLINPKITQKDPGWSLVREFRLRLKKRGVGEKYFRLVDTINPVRAVGNGSATQRIQVQDRILSMASGFDEVGRQNAIYDSVAAEVGFDKADRYVALPQERPPTINIVQAESENDSFHNGRPRFILATDNHWVHCGLHLDYLDNVAQLLEIGDADPFQSVTTLNLGLEHTRAHYEQLALDQTRKQEARKVKQRMQQLNAIAEQWSQKLQREARDMQGQNGGPDELEQKLAQNDALFEQKTRHREISAAQNLRIKDANGAAKIGMAALAERQKRDGLNLSGES